MSTKKQVLTTDQLSNLPMFISSLNHHEPTGGFYIKVKDAVAGNALFNKSAKATGTIWLSVRGDSSMFQDIERQLLEVYGTEQLIGTEIPKEHASWGENVPANSNGEALDGVYDVIVH